MRLYIHFSDAMWYFFDISSCEVDLWSTMAPTSSSKGQNPTHKTHSSINSRNYATSEHPVPNATHHVLIPMCQSIYIYIYICRSIRATRRIPSQSAKYSTSLISVVILSLRRKAMSTRLRSYMLLVSRIYYWKKHKCDTCLSSCFLLRIIHSSTHLTSHAQLVSCCSSNAQLWATHWFAKPAVSRE